MNKPNDAILARLSISQWSGRKADKGVAQEIHIAKRASDQAGKYVKNLIDPKALTGINAAAGALRAMHHDLTRPWDDGGRRLLPGSMIADYKEKLMLLSSDFQDEVDKFLKAYPEELAKAQQWLGDLYDEGDYPLEDMLPKYFRVQEMFEPIPSGAAIPMSLKDREQMAEQIEVQTREALAESAQALFFRVKNTIEGLRTRLSSYGDKIEAGEKTKFHRSVLDEAINLASLLPALNIENDPFLTGATERLRASLEAWDVDALKESKAARNEAIREAGEILLELEAHG